MKLPQQGTFMKQDAHLPCGGYWGRRAEADWSCWCSDSSGFLWTLMTLRKGEDRRNENEQRTWIQVIKFISLLILKELMAKISFVGQLGSLQL